MQVELTIKSSNSMGFNTTWTCLDNARNCRLAWTFNCCPYNAGLFNNFL